MDERDRILDLTVGDGTPASMLPKVELGDQGDEPEKDDESSDQTVERKLGGRAVSTGFAKDVRPEVESVLGNSRIYI